MGKKQINKCTKKLNNNKTVDQDTGPQYHLPVNRINHN